MSIKTCLLNLSEYFSTSNKNALSAFFSFWPRTSGLINFSPHIRSA